MSEATRAIHYRELKRELDLRESEARLLADAAQRLSGMGRPRWPMDP